MTWTQRRGLVYAMVFAASSTLAVAANAEPPQAAAAKAAGLGTPASQELIGSLSKEIGATPQQAAGAAGALFGVAQSRLKADEFSQIAAAVPGMDSLLKAAPAAGGAGGAVGALSQISGSAGGL